MQKIFIVIGLFFILIGILLPWLIKLGLGHLPGDIFIKREDFSFYFPITTSILLSVIISLLLWFFHK